MVKVKRDVAYTMLASALPALGNFFAVAFALRHMDAVWLGKSYALLAFFFVAIDLFNFGSPRIFTLDRVRSKVPTLIFLDCLSALGSTAVFVPIGLYLAQCGLIAQTQLAGLMVLAPICYGMSHFSLGALRLCGRSGVICAISLTSALSRVLIIYWLVKHRDLQEYLPDLLLLVEAGYGAMLLLAYLTARQADRKQFSFRMFDYRTFFIENRREILGSWYANAIFSGAKHLDMILVTFIVGPAGGSLYRGVKSIHNLAFNFGQGIALLLTGKLKHRADLLLLSIRRCEMAAGGLVSLVIIALASLLACRIKLFPLAEIGSHALQVAFMFAAFAGATLIFLCRVLSLLVFSANRASFVLVSTLEVSMSLILISGMSYAVGLIGALSGILIATATVMSMSFALSRREARKVLMGTIGK